MSTLRIEELTKHYGDTLAVDRATLAVESGEFVSLLGPSGCGKTTILRMIAGLIEPDAGRILIGGTDRTWHPPEKRDIGLVFQSYALFPHMTVAENVAFGLRQRRVPADEIDRRVAEALELVRLSGLQARMPRQLSGGQQQRVALARAIAPRPTLLLLDEPLSNLDAKLRDMMRIELRLLQQGLGISTVFVTHDQEEALSMSDRICVLNAGRIEQIGTPREVYYQPGSSFVAGFFGRSNALEGIVHATGQSASVQIDGMGELRVEHLPAGLAVGDPVRLTLRRECLALRFQDPGLADNGFAARVRMSSFAGNSLVLVVRLDAGLELTAELTGPQARQLPEPEARVWLSIDPRDVIIMAG
ncbi:MAG: ABC transporter ATP-binding protein [Burkholderiaceae bacterium]